MNIQSVFSKNYPNRRKKYEFKPDIVFKELLTANPFSLGYLERMTGYPNKYKIRVGNYRIGITLDKQNNLIICQRIAHRRDIYRIFP